MQNASKYCHVAQCTKELINKALAGVGRDNITAIVIQVGDAPEETLENNVTETVTKDEAVPEELAAISFKIVSKPTGSLVPQNCPESLEKAKFNAINNSSIIKKVIICLLLFTLFVFVIKYTTRIVSQYINKGDVVIGEEMNPEVILDKEKQDKNVIQDNPKEAIEEKFFEEIDKLQKMEFCE